MNDKKKNQQKYRGVINSNKDKEKENSFKTKPKDGYIVCEGIILEAYSNARFLVELDSGNQIKATLAGKLRQNYIKILVGDRVVVEISVYDVTQGRISRRL